MRACTTAEGQDFPGEPLLARRGGRRPGWWFKGCLGRYATLIHHPARCTRYPSCPGGAILALLFLVLSLTACAEKPAEPPANAALVIDGAKLWDGTGAPAIDDSVVVITGDRITAAGPRAAVTVPQGAKVIDGKGKTLIPGIINMHGHLGFTKGLVQAKENYSKESLLAQLRQYARYGVTTVQSLGLDSGPMFEIRGPATANEEPRAAVFTAGRGFTGKGGYPSGIKGLEGVAVEVDNADQIKAHMEELASQKVDVVKIWVDDEFGAYKKIRPDLYKTIIEEAHKRNFRVMAHVFYLADAKGLVAAGIDGLAHSVRDHEVDDDLIKMMKEKGTFSVSTLSREESTFAYAEPPAFLDDPFFMRWADPEVVKALKDPAWGAKIKANPNFPKLRPAFDMASKNLKKLFDAGVKIGFGTDTGPPSRFQGYFEHLELELMVKAGLTPAQSLQIATLDTARRLGIEKDFGSLEKGKRADLILLDADPTESILNTRKISHVWIGGREVN
jgi:imidazolonepropionase-like amidohydrolase